MGGIISVFNWLWKLSPQGIYHLITGRNENQWVDRELEKIAQLPRFKPFNVRIEGRDFRIADSASFIFQYKEIFKDKIYQFPSANESPYIIDGGANIGLASLFFKSIFPNSRIIAFEPDPEIHSICQNNFLSSGFSDIVLKNEALYNDDCLLTFQCDGSDGGSISSKSSDNCIQVAAVSLRQFLTTQVDLLKLDVEGCEWEIIDDCRDLLINVDRIFIEYHSRKSEPQKLSAILSVLTDYGFRIHFGKAGLVSRQPFLKMPDHSDYDMLINIYAFK